MPQNIEYNLAIPFKRFHDLEGKVAEYNIEFRTDDSRLEDLIDFITLDCVHRVNIHFSTTIPIQIVKSVNKIKDCVYVRLDSHQYVYHKELKKEGIRFFFDYTFPISNFTDLHFVIDMGVSDIFMADDLVYCLPDVKKICEKNNIQTRLVLNLIPITLPNKGRDVTSFIPRPMDTKFLSKFIDIFEFDCGDPYDWHEFEVLLKIYYHKHYWFGDLTELNEDIDLPFGFPDDQIDPHLTEFRHNCNRSCDRGRRCTYCQDVYNLAEVFVEKGYKFENLVNTEEVEA